MSTAAADATDEQSEGAEWGSPPERSEFVPEPECPEPLDEPGSSDCAR